MYLSASFDSSYGIIFMRLFGAPNMAITASPAVVFNKSIVFARNLRNFTKYSACDFFYIFRVQFFRHFCISR